MTASELSRRQIFIAGGFALATAYLAPGALFGEADDAVEDAIKESATAKIEVQALRRNVSVLSGPGGNIAVLTGSDGKLLVDTEIISAQPQLSAALGRGLEP